MATVRYAPHGRDGFEVTLTTSGKHTVTATLPSGGEKPSVAGSEALLSNDALTSNLIAYGTNELSVRRLRAEEKRKSHRAQAADHARHATAISEMVEQRSGLSRPGWCSACFNKTAHSKVASRRDMRGTYLCGGCGAPTTPCVVPTCTNMANRGIRALTTPRYCAEHRHDIPAFTRMTDRLEALDDYADWLKYDKINAARTTKLLGSVVIVGACVTPAAFAAAPAIGGAIGAMTGLSGAAATSHGLALLGGGSLAAGGLGMAGGSMVVTAIGSAVGGLLGGVTTAEYVRADPSFRIERLREGRGSPVILANGFLTNGQTGWAEWQTMIDRRYEDAPIYRVHWGSRELKDIQSLLVAGGAKQAMRAALVSFGRQASKKAGNLPGLSSLFLAADVAANPWSVARTRAEMTGAALADLIARTDEREFVLIGHSLGARVMVKAAQLLGTRPGERKIEAMHLLGAAVGTKGNWQALDAAVVGNVWNYHSRNDWVLARLYTAAQLGQPAVGCRGFQSKFNRIIDKDMSRTVTGHGDYFSAVSLSR